MSDQAEGIIYTHPTLRTKSHDQLLIRLQGIRDRRLLAAIEHKSAADARQAKLADKIADQWEKLNERNKNKLAKISQELSDLEASINRQIELGHKLSIVEL